MGHLPYAAKACRPEKIPHLIASTESRSFFLVGLLRTLNTDIYGGVSKSPAGSWLSCHRAVYRSEKAAVPNSVCDILSLPFSSSPPLEMMVLPYLRED